MALNFGSLATTTVSTISYLKPWNIYENVKFEGIEGPKSGTSASGNEWSRYDIKFSCPDGTYTHSLFEPKDDKQRTFPNQNGHNNYFASPLEEAMNLLALIGITFNPEGFKKVQENVSKCRDFETVIKLFNKCIGTPETTTSMKLVGRNSNGAIYATLPRWTAVSKKLVDDKRPWDEESNHYQTFIPRDCVFGNNLGWSAYEMKNVEDYKNAKPTAAPTSDPLEMSEETTDNSELDDLLDL